MLELGLSKPNACSGVTMSCRLKSAHVLLLLSVLISVARGTDLTYSLDEGRPGGTTVGDVRADYDLRPIMTADEYDNLAYRILASGNDYAHFFRIGNSTGQLLTAAPIDRDVLPHCQRTPTCVISLGIGVATIGSFFRRIDVDINLNDLNDNDPVFPNPVDLVQFYENSAEGESTSIVGARDIDTGNNSVVNYYVETPDVPFRVEMEAFVDGSSLVKIIVAGKLDRELKDYYRIKIVAEDGGTPRRSGSIEVDISITDVNDNSPQFDRPFYNITLNEDTPINTTFETISATDLDLDNNGEVEYRLSPFNSEKVKGLFAINSTTGELLLIGKLVYVPNEEIIIYVEAFDKGDQPRSSRIVVYINIKDSSNNPPEINVNILQGRISEYANIGAPVAHIGVTDDDTGRNGKVDCIAVSDFFTLERYEDKQYKAVVAKALNTEQADKHVIQIVCQDSGSPPLNSTASLTVVVLDENDNKPRFTQSVYYPKIMENNAVGAVVAMVTAEDIDTGNNALVTYSILNSTGYPFWIDPDNGNIRANFQLDRENVTQVRLIVQAEDNGQPRLSSTATVILSILDKNDNKPVFSQPNYEFFVYENLPYNTSVDQLTATDIDNGENGTIVFQFGEVLPSSFPFTLYSDGNIKVIRSLDRETQSEYRFTVVAADQGTPALSTSVTVTVNVLDQNDNEPVFVFPDDDNNTATIPLSSNPDSVGIKVVADDRDSGPNGRITYEILDSNLTNLFYMVNHYGLGEIKLHRLPNSQEALKYKLRLRAEDNGNPKKHATKTLTVSFTQTVTEESRQNLLIAISLGCVTVVLSIAIVITIYVIRRSDYQRRKNEPAFSEKDGMQIVPSDNIIKHPGDLGSTSSGSKDSLKKVSFSTDNNSSSEMEGPRDRSRSPLVNLESTKMLENNRMSPNATSSPRSFSSSSQNDDDVHKLDPATVLQIHRSLLQSHDQHWPNHRDGHTPPLTKEMLTQHEDNGSESSGETATYDSGRGGSESDIQTSMSQSQENDHIKTVTFANKPKLHHFTNENHWPDVTDYGYSHKPYNPNNISNPQKPVLPTRDYVIPPKHSSQQNRNNFISQPYQNYKNFGHKLSPISDNISHMTSYDDDDDTTTSGSYTIDNDHDWMNDNQPRPYYLSHNEAYC